MHLSLSCNAPFFPFLLLSCCHFLSHPPSQDFLMLGGGSVRSGFYFPPSQFPACISCHHGQWRAHDPECVWFFLFVCFVLFCYVSLSWSLWYWTHPARWLGAQAAGRRWEWTSGITSERKTGVRLRGGGWAFVVRKRDCSETNPRCQCGGGDA